MGETGLGMRMRRDLLGLMAAVMAISVMSGVGSADAAGIDRTVTLPDSANNVVAIAIDDTQVYVAGFGSSVLVFEHDGDPVGSIPTPNEISDLAISSDGSVLWVSSWPSPDVVAYSTTTLAEVDKVTLAGGCADRVGTSLSFLVTYDSCAVNNVVIVDLAGDRVPFSPSETVPWPREIEMGPDMPSMFIAGEEIGGMKVVDIYAGAATVVGSLGGLDYAFDYALNPTASEVVIASTNTPTQFPLYELPSPFLNGAFDVMTPGARPVGVSYAGDGSWILTVSANGPDLEYLLYYPHFTASPADDPVWEYVLEGHEHHPQGLAVNNDGTVMYSLTKSEDVNYLQIKEIDRRSLPGSIAGTIRNVDGEPVDLGHADLLDLDREVLQSADAGGDGTYRFDNVQPGEYLVAFWNGDETTIWDYFPRYYADAPRLRSDLATRVVVQENQTTTGIDGRLAWLYLDMFGDVFEGDIYWLGLSGITKGCNPPSNDLFCPDVLVTRGQMAAFINRAFDLEDGAPVTFVDDDASIFEADIERLAAAGITKGCNPPVNDRYCADQLVTRGQMAAFFHRGYTNVVYAAEQAVEGVVAEAVLGVSE